MFWYAAGPYRESTREAGSAFSKGMLLGYNTDSKLSELNLLAAVGTARIAGVAKADSTESIDSEVPFIVAHPDTLFHADIPDNIASQFTDGERLDVVKADANISAVSGDHVVGNSTSTARIAIAARGDHRNVIDSDRSRVVVSLLGAAGEQAFL